MSGPKHALTLVSCKDGKMILHEEVAKKVLESVEAKNRPVAIISIAGMFRKGKSFFLNFVLRYLKSKRDPGWIRPESGLLEGFDWNSNRDGVTSGITVWSEVFVVNEVAIVLIDTQGLFDRRNSTAEDTYIMVLSFLFSSFQILNHHEDLNSSDLKNFELFAKYGMALEIKSKNFKGFQNLMFLVRDWKHTSVHPYGLKDGNQSVDEMFETEMNEELPSAHETFKYYEKVECFLMPYPGQNVARNEEFSGEINQIDEEFLNHMKTLVEHLIDSVKPKKVLLQEELTGEQLLDFMKKYVEYINNQELPEPKSLLQCQLEILRNKVEKVCVSKYNNLIRYGTNDKLLNKTKMVELHKKCADEVIDEFDTLQAFENKEKIDTLKLEFSQLLEANEYMHYTTTMEKEVEKNLLRIFEESQKSYSTFLSDQSKKSKLIKGFINKALEHREKDITAFEKETIFGDNDRIQKLRQSLDQDMDQMYNEHLDAFLKKHKIQEWFFSTMGGIITSLSTGVATAAVAVATDAMVLATRAVLVVGTVGTAALVAGGATVREVVAVATGVLAFGCYIMIKKMYGYRRRTKNSVQ